MAAEAYQWLENSGQIIGLLPGLKGAADYEQLVDERVKSESDKTFLLSSSARRLMFSQGYAQIGILFFILLGNVGYLLSRQRKAKPQGGE